MKKYSKTILVVLNTNIPSASFLAAVSLAAHVVSANMLCNGMNIMIKYCNLNTNYLPASSFFAAASLAIHSGMRDVTIDVSETISTYAIESEYRVSLPTISFLLRSDCSLLLCSCSSCRFIVLVTCTISNKHC